MPGMVRRLLRRCGLFLETDDAPILIDFDHAELLGGLWYGNLDNADGNIGAGVHVLIKHLGVIHLVDVIAGEDENELGPLATDGVDVLVHGVGRALIPLLRDAHLRGKDFDVIAEAGERRPARANVTVQTEGLVLGENKNATKIRIDAVRERDVDDAVESAERNGGLGAIAGERPETFALASGKEYDDGIPHIGHWLPPSAASKAAQSNNRSGEKHKGGRLETGKHRPARGRRPIEEHLDAHSGKCLVRSCLLQ